jgi:hypothetical protein
MSPLARKGKLEGKAKGLTNEWVKPGMVHYPITYLSLIYHPPYKNCFHALSRLKTRCKTILYKSLVALIYPS